MHEDVVIKCRDCGKEFILPAEEQDFFDEQGIESKPVRCKACRDAHSGVRTKATSRRVGSEGNR